VTGGIDPAKKLDLPHFQLSIKCGGIYYKIFLLTVGKCLEAFSEQQSRGDPWAAGFIEAGSCPLCIEESAGRAASIPAESPWQV
jgi:hypothetical protein